MLRPASLFLAAITSVASAQIGTSPLLDFVTQAPALEAARKRIDAARARTEAAGRLADPEIEAMGSRIDAMESGSMWEINLRQPLPKPGERAADRERSRAIVAVAEAEYALTAGELAADVSAALAEAEGATGRAQLIESQLNRLNAVLNAIDVRLSAGGATRIADRLTVQSRVAALQLQLETAQRAAADALAEVRARLGVSGDALLPAFSAPVATEVSASDAAVLALATARVAEANAMGRIARASGSPATAVGLRFERERRNMGNEDTLGLAFSSEIPWRGRRYARAEVRAAEADRAAAQADAAAARHRISSAVSRVERAERLAATARRLAGETRTRLDAEHEALNRAASVGSTAGAMAGESAVLHAVDILDKATETQLQIIETETAARTARAELWRYIPANRLLKAQP